MIQKMGLSTKKLVIFAVSLCSFTLVSMQSVVALTPIPTPDPKPGSFGLEATKRQPPPTQGATITTPGNGATFSTSPITVSGICPNGLLVQVLNNGVMVGAVMCESGSFSLQVSLFAGTNELSAIVYDDLDQPGPVSNSVTVNYTDTNFTAFGALITLTSSYGRRSATAGSELLWPLQLSGGAGPYAFSIDWGDGSAAELKSQSLAGLVNIIHTYKKAGIYQVNIKVTDANGVSAFLQLIAVSSGQVESQPGDEVTKQQTRTIIIWIPAVITLLMLGPAYWLGRRSQIVSLRKKMLKEHAAEDKHTK
jgi:hypothetical protein